MRGFGGLRISFEEGGDTEEGKSYLIISSAMENAVILTESQVDSLQRPPSNPFTNAQSQLSIVQNIHTEMNNFVGAVHAGVAMDPLALYTAGKISKRETIPIGSGMLQISLNVELKRKNTPRTARPAPP
jgi:hypothetical protein